MRNGHGHTLYAISCYRRDLAEFERVKQQYLFCWRLGILLEQQLQFYKRCRELQANIKRYEAGHHIGIWDRIYWQTSLLFGLPFTIDESVSKPNEEQRQLAKGGYKPGAIAAALLAVMSVGLSKDDPLQRMNVVRRRALGVRNLAITASTALYIVYMLGQVSLAVLKMSLIGLFALSMVAATITMGANHAYDSHRQEQIAIAERRLGGTLSDKENYYRRSDKNFVYRKGLDLNTVVGGLLTFIVAGLICAHPINWVLAISLLVLARLSAQFGGLGSVAVSEQRLGITDKIVAGLDGLQASDAMPAQPHEGSWLFNQLQRMKAFCLKYPFAVGMSTVVVFSFGYLALAPIIAPFAAHALVCAVPALQAFSNVARAAIVAGTLLLAGLIGRAFFKCSNHKAHGGHSHKELPEPRQLMHGRFFKPIAKNDRSAPITARVFEKRFSIGSRAARH